MIMRFKWSYWRKKKYSKPVSQVVYSMIISGNQQNDKKCGKISSLNC